MIVMPALAARAAAFRFFFSNNTFTPLSHISIGMYYCSPMIALFYFMSTQHQIHMTYYMFIYFFAGNFMFGTTAYIPLVMFIDRPIYALLNLKKDVRDARHSQYYKLSDYLENFKPLM
jgi:hypothetical protein